jgi:acetyl-CoA C-acetyltransferase
VLFKPHLQLIKPAVNTLLIALLGSASCSLCGQLGNKGMESMSNAPLMIGKSAARDAVKRGVSAAELSRAMADAMRRDGLTDPLVGGVAMGMHGEKAAVDHAISRVAQDAYAAESYERARTAAASGWFANEIVTIPKRTAKAISATESAVSSELITADEEPMRTDRGRGDFGSLQPAFLPKSGTVTAGNASTISDGAAAVVLASRDAVNRLGLLPIAKILGFADAARAPDEFPVAPADGDFNDIPINWHFWPQFFSTPAC